MHYYLQSDDFFLPYDEIKSQLPFLFLGFYIKSDFDKGIYIDNKYKPFNFKHYSRTNADIFKCEYYYGIKISNTGKIQKLIDSLNKSSINNEIITLGMYKNMISKYDLTCDDCYKHYRIGSFPLDIRHLYKFIHDDFKTLVTDFYNIKNGLNIAGLHLNILTSYPDLTFKTINID